MIVENKYKHMKKGLLFGSLAITAVGAGVLMNSGAEEHTGKYQPRSKFEQKAAHSKLEGREAYYQMLYTNVNTGKVEPSDRLASLKAVRNMPRAKSLSLNFTEMGPDNVGGRSRALIADPNNDNLMFAGSVTGGLFKSTDAGNTWSRVQEWDDQVIHTGISSMEYTNNGTLYVATGGAAFEGGITGASSGTMQNPIGVWYSTDNGATFSQLTGGGLGTTGAINQVYADPVAQDKICLLYTSPSPRD